MEKKIASFSYKCPECDIELHDYYLDEDFVLVSSEPTISNKLYSNCTLCEKTFVMDRISKTEYTITISNYDGLISNFDHVHSNGSNEIE